MTDPVPNNKKPARVSAPLVFILLFVAYGANFRSIHFGDSAPASVLPFSILLKHSLYLDDWFPAYVPSTAEENGTYYLAVSRGHLMSTYPIIMPLVITPLYIVPAWLVSRQNPPLAHNDVVFLALIDVMEDFCASLIAALSGVLFFLALRRICPRTHALFLTLIYGLASSTWTISSQSLWRHGFTELCFALLLWGLLLPEDQKGRAVWCGFALAGAGANNLANIILILPLLLYFARRGRREFLRCFIPLAALGALVAGYNFHFFGHLMGGYARIIVHSPNGAHVFRAAPVWTALLGLLISPSRGLLIYMPWSVLALWGMARGWKENSRGWERYLIAGMVGFYLEHATMGTWWGGWAYGPRYLASILPLIVFFLVPVWNQVLSKRTLRSALVAAVLVSLWIQFVGAFCYPEGHWGAVPVNVDRNPQRLWDWQDTQIGRNWQAGLATPDLYYELFLLPELLRGPATPTSTPSHAD